MSALIIILNSVTLITLITLLLLLLITIINIIASRHHFPRLSLFASSLEDCEAQVLSSNPTLAPAGSDAAKKALTMAVPWKQADVQCAGVLFRGF